MYKETSSIKRGPGRSKGEMKGKQHGLYLVYVEQRQKDDFGQDSEQGRQRGF